MGREQLPRGRARAIIERLRDHIKRYHNGNRARFAKKVNLKTETVRSWFKEGRLTVPDLVALVKIAEHQRISLDWLLGIVDVPRRESRPPSDAECLSYFRDRVVAGIALPSYASLSDADAIVPKAETMINRLSEQYSPRLRELAGLVREELERGIPLRELMLVGVRERLNRLPPDDPAWQEEVVRFAERKARANPASTGSRVTATQKRPKSRRASRRGSDGRTR